MPVAAAAAVAAAKTGRRVRYSLSRNDDMRINGGDLSTLSAVPALLQWLSHRDPGADALPCASLPEASPW